MVAVIAKGEYAMAIKKYYSTKNGKKVFKGYEAKPILNGRVLAVQYFDTKEKTKAYVWHEKKISEAKKGYDQDLSLSDACKEYLEKLDVTVNGRRYARQGIEILELDADVWMAKQISSFTTNDITRLLEMVDKASEQRLGRKRVSLKREVEVLSAVCNCYKFTHNNDFSNPVTPLHKKRWCYHRASGNEAVSLTEVEARNFLLYLSSLLDPIYYHIALWQLTSHRQRIGEVLSLEWNDVDWTNEIAWLTGTMLQTDESNMTTRNTKQYHTKEGRSRIPLFFGGENQHLKDSLLALRNLNRDPRWIFADERGNVPSTRQVTKIYKRSGFFAEEGLGSHKCRKTALTLATIKCGTDFAKRLGGHASDSAHVRYIDRELKELHNPVPAVLARTLGLLSPSQESPHS